MSGSGFWRGVRGPSGANRHCRGLGRCYPRSALNRPGSSCVIQGGGRAVVLARYGGEHGCQTPQSERSPPGMPPPVPGSRFLRRRVRPAEWNRVASSPSRRGARGGGAARFICRRHGRGPRDALRSSTFRRGRCRPTHTCDRCMLIETGRLVAGIPPGCDSPGCCGVSPRSAPDPQGLGSRSVSLARGAVARPGGRGRAAEWPATPGRPHPIARSVRVRFRSHGDSRAAVD